jgi:NAD(P)H-hydrate epimerase
MAGAAILAGRAALKAGAGLVTPAIPESSQPIAAACIPEAVTLPLPETKTGAVSPTALKTIADWKKLRGLDLFLIGPGLGVNPETAEFVYEVLPLLDAPFAMDADALNGAALLKNPRTLFANAAPHIITPHPGEASRLLKTAVPRGETRNTAVLKLCELTGGVALLKGSSSLISDGKTVSRNPTGNPALAKAGTGDVLAGLITGFWAQFGKERGFNLQTARQAAEAGAYIHGLCADLAAKHLGERSVLAGELLNYLPKL